MLIRPRTTVIAGLLIIAGLLGVGYWWSVNDGAFAPRPEQSWDQENLKRHDAGCPTAIYDAPGGVLRICPIAKADGVPTKPLPECLADCAYETESGEGVPA